MNEMYNTLLEKAERILKENMYEIGNYPWGNYRMISPAPGCFDGIWNWDSAFHGIGMIPFDIEIAKEQILGYIQFQLENGMLPDVVYENGQKVTAFSKPPVMGYAAQRVYDACKDKDFARKVYRFLVKNEVFWAVNRKHNGLFHYDADESVCKDKNEYKKYVGFESGWDNSPRWDNEPQNLWAIDLNCYMYMTYCNLAYFACEIGEDENQWQQKAEELKENIERKLWNAKMSAYADYNFVTSEFSDVLSPASFMPMFVGIASTEHGQAMDKVARDCFLPGMPSVAYNHKDYDDKNDNAYWRGPTWLNVAYFAAKGLKNYGYIKTAEEIRDTVLNWVYKSGDYIYENYNATTGKGLSYNNFSWSCVFVREFINNF